MQHTNAYMTRVATANRELPGMSDPAEALAIKYNLTPEQVAEMKRKAGVR